MHDPYLYPDTEVLKNLLGIMDSKKLQDAESDYVTLRLSEIAEDDRRAEGFDFPALCRMNRRVKIPLLYDGFFSFAVVRQGI